MGQAHFQAAERNRRAEWARGMREAQTVYDQRMKLRAQKMKDVKQANAAIMITKNWRGNRARKQVKAGMEYFKSTGKDLSTIPEDLQKLIHDLYGGLDQRVIQAVEKLEVMNVGYVKELVYELGQRVLELEEAQAATATFHFAKPEDVDSSFASVSVDMGKHTAPRDALPIQITPEKDDEGVDPMFVADLKQQIADGHKKLEDMWASPLKIHPNEGKKEKAKIDPFNPSPTRKLKEKVEKSDNPYPELDKNLGFL